MAQITGIPGGRNISLGMGTDSVGMPRTNPNDFGAESWRNVRELGQQVTRSSIVAMQHFIDEDHQRQEDEARLDAVHIENERAKKVDELSQKKNSEAFNTPEEYLQYSQQQYDALQTFNKDNPDSRRGGELYNRRVQEATAQVDAMNVRRLQRHAMVERERLHVQSLEVANAGALERLSKDPSRLRHELDTVIFPNIAQQVEAQGYGNATVEGSPTGERMADFYKRQAESGALKTALQAMTAQHGPAAALEMLRSGDMAGIRSDLGEQAWSEVFGTYEAKLQAAEVEQQERALEVQLNREIALLRRNGEDDLTIQTKMVEAYGTTLGVPAVNTIFRGVPDIDPQAAGADVAAAGKSYLRSLVMGGSIDELRIAATKRGADYVLALGAAEAEYIKFRQQGDAARTYRTEQVLNGIDSDVAHNIRLGTPEAFDRAERSVEALTALNDNERLYITGKVAEARAKAQVSRQTELERTLRHERVVSDAARAERSAALIGLAATLDIRPENPEQSQEFQQLPLHEQRIVREELRAREEGRYEPDPVRQLMAYGRWGAMPYAAFVALPEAEIRRMFREVGGPASEWGKKLTEKREKKQGAGEYSKTATTLTDQLRAAFQSSSMGVPTTSEFTYLEGAAQAELAQWQNDYYFRNDMAEPTYAERSAALASIVQRTELRRLGIAPTQSGTEITKEQMAVEFPELDSQAIRTTTRYAGTTGTPTIAGMPVVGPLGSLAEWWKTSEPTVEQNEPIWEAFDFDGRTEMVQTGIPFLGPNVTSPDANTASVLGQIRQYVMDNYTDPLTGLSRETFTLNYYPVGNMLVLKDIAGRSVAKFARATGELR